MAQYQYGVLARNQQEGQTEWVFTAPGGAKTTSQDFLLLINKLGNQGWNVVVAADLGGGPNTDLLLQR